MMTYANTLSLNYGARAWVFKMLKQYSEIHTFLTYESKIYVN